MSLLYSENCVILACSRFDTIRSRYRQTTDDTMTTAEFAMLLQRLAEIEVAIRSSCELLTKYCMFYYSVFYLDMGFMSEINELTISEQLRKCL